MMNKIFEKYPAYKDSGVEWLGEIPEGWELTRLGTRFKERRVKVSDKDYAPLSVTKNGIVPQLANAAKSNDGDNRKLVRKGDFVINSRSDRKGSSGIAKENGSVSLINIVMEPKGINPDYCNYLLKGYAFVEEYYRNGHGIVADLWTTRYDEMKDIKISFPPLPEQTAIANYLDQKTDKIDTAIAQKEKMIALLKERKQIMIQNAVTKGLDPNAKMKDSGVEWIGEIPVGWEITKLAHYASVNNGSTPSRAKPNYWYNGSVNWLSSGKVNDEIVTQPSEKITERAVSDSSLKIFPKSTIIMGIVGQGKTRGTCSVLGIESAINQNMVGIITNDKVNNIFLYNVFKVGYDFIRRGNGSNQEAMNCEVVKNINILIPPLQEQQQIVSYIETQSTKIDKAIGVQKQQIEKLKEYKAVLIDSAVTGKIKVC